LRKEIILSEEGEVAVDFITEVWRGLGDTEAGEMFRWQQ
jgi:hypothetical protein